MLLAVRFLCPNHKQIDSLTLDGVKTAIRSQLRPQNIEVSISGDVTIPELESLVLRYLGTVPAPRTASGSAISFAAQCTEVHNKKPT